MGKEIEIWGGVECTINRVRDQYFDQSEYSGHYNRGTSDIDLIGSLGIKMLRYPVLWEKHQRIKDGAIDWTFIEKNLERLRELQITPIAGLVHHGSGPRHVSFFDGSFENGLAEYAGLVIQKFPWLEYFTPVNEPLTTARFCGLYGHWYPHGTSDYTFYKVLLSECKATVMAMREIRKYNPGAKLIQTEDLGKCYSTPLLAYQADFENQRRWISYDFLCGKVNQQHPLWNRLLQSGISEEEILYFVENNCVPHVAGFNYYITSERYLDHDVNKYPEQYHGGNGKHKYADIETVKVPLKQENGLSVLLHEAWEHLQIPLAITECHLHSSREDQMRWFNTVWKTVNKVKEEGVDIKAITAWAIFGLTGWNKLVTEPWGVYEPGVFNVSSSCPRPTALARFIQELTKHKVYYHPVLENEGWWQRANRQQYGIKKVVQMKRKKATNCSPLLILGQTDTLGAAYARVCDDRNIHHLLISSAELDLQDEKSIEQVIGELKPWGVVDTSGYLQLDAAESNVEACLNASCNGPVLLSSICSKNGIRLLTFSTDQVFNGVKDTPYTESDKVDPLNIYGLSKALAEEKITTNNPDALIIRTGNFFSPWEQQNFVSATLRDVREGRIITAAEDVLISPTYVPDLVSETLDLLLDGAQGIYHVSNSGKTSWADFATLVAIMAGYDTASIRRVSTDQMEHIAPRPLNSVLESEKGIKLPPFEMALQNFFEALGVNYQTGIAV
ncbi:family 1 glycosylhydrolase [Segetibacter sp.]|uniref:family 1 glycosylhydrolase n=1 Tax=Segetibacter sp. TaxID=2231182 RepID=UPI00261AFCB6|nr:family 1 glycosylhydrolase [Segetibacter sp.]MCW3080288.1 dTDP-4-dehydrorhamnose reductase [Segetibacter sp.]